MEIVMKCTEDLQEYKYNPRNNEKAIDGVAESIKEFGFKVPIIIDREGLIIAGHTRLKAAERLGIREVPCIVADDLTPEQIKAMTNEGDIVIEPFCGSGTTLIACEQLGRRCYGMELDPIYCDVIIKRWEELTGEKAVKL